VRRDGPSHHLWISRKTPTPETVGEHGRRHTRILVLVASPEHPSVQCFDTQRIEEFRCHGARGDLFRRFRIGHGKAEVTWGLGKYPLQRSGVIAQGLKVIVRKLAPGTDPRNALHHPDQFLGIVYRQMAQQHGVHYAEDDGAGTDAQREEYRHRKRRTRISGQHARAKTKVVPRTLF